jgi:hypothetical protein
MDDAELRGLLEQIQEDVKRAVDMTEEVGRQVADHRLTVAGVVGDLKLNLALLAANVNALVTSVNASVEQGRESSGGVQELVNEMKQQRSHHEWQAALDKAGEPKKFGGKSIGEWSVLGLVLALAIIGALLGVKFAGLGSLLAGLGA